LSTNIVSSIENSAFFYSQTLFEGEKLGHPYGLVYFDGYLFWTEFQQGIVQRLNIKTKEFIELVIENPPLFEIRLFDNSSQNGWYSLFSYFSILNMNK